MRAGATVGKPPGIGPGRLLRTYLHLPCRDPPDFRRSPGRGGVPAYPKVMATTR